MTTLDSRPLADLLDSLFAQSDAAEAAMDREMGDIPPADRQAMLGSKTDYVALYTRARDLPLAVSRQTGALLYMLARNSRARCIVEFGTSFGVSTLHLAAALRDNGGGRLITSEFEPSKIARARQNIAAGGLSDLVEIRAGDALQTLAHDLPDSVDLLLLDGAKGLYPDILSLVEPHLRIGGLVVADNADMSPDYLARVRPPAQGYLSVPFGEDVELSMRLGG